MSERTLKTAVIGVGAFGRHHARVYAELEGSELVAVVDADESVAQAAAERHGCAALTDPSDLPDDIDAVSVAVPTIHHAAVAVPLLERGVACLVEKPFAPDVEQGEAMLAAAEKGGAAIATGHIERFNPAVVALAEHDVRPRFLECHRIAPFSFRSVDVGVVLDLMIHDLDLVLHLAGADADNVQSVGVPVLTAHEDIANARIEFTNGCVADITASRVGTKTERKLRLFSESAYMVLDFARREGWTYRKSPDLTLAKVQEIAAGAENLADLKDVVFDDLLTIEPVRIVEHDALEAELGSFLKAVREGTRPVVSGEDGLRALRLALQVGEAIRTNAAKAGIAL